MSTIDLNADLGEGVGRDPAELDAALLRLVTSANIACGGHAGSPDSMARVCEQAAQYGVAIGAQISYVDVENFGRRKLDVPPIALVQQLVEQIELLDTIARTYGTRVTYVKPHGALYNAAADDATIVHAIIEAIQTATRSPTHPPAESSLVREPRSLVLLGLAGSSFERVAHECGQDFVPEAFADRAYTPTARLVPRNVDGAVLHDLNLVTNQAVHLAVQQQVTSIDGSTIAVQARSLCVHGDTRDAVELLHHVRNALWMHGLTLTAFAPPPLRLLP